MSTFTQLSTSATEHDLFKVESWKMSSAVHGNTAYYPFFTDVKMGDIWKPLPGFCETHTYITSHVLLQTRFLMFAFMLSRSR